MRRTLVPVALLVLLPACTAPPPASSATTASPPLTAMPSASASPPTVPTAAATPITLPSSAQVSASSGIVVWAFVADSRLFRSTDRGDTWQDRSAALPGSPNREIAFISDNEGWLATPGPAGTQCTFRSVGIAHTVDAGSKWDQLVVGTASSSAGIADSQCKERVAFADAQRGFLSAYDPNSAPVIYRTTDGGRTWSASRPLPDPPGFTTRGAGFTLRAGRVRAFGTTLLVDASGQLDGRPVSYVFRSVDGGASWSYLVTLPATEGAFAIVTASRWLRIAPPNSSKETTDGGATWHAFTTDYSQAAPIAPEVVFGDPLIGYATARGAIQRTVDGGGHWTGIRTPGT
jgi:photosystem II stability/assembly factor-like uncharacterized protein